MFYVYIVTNKPRGTLYIGHTQDLVQRVWEHKSKQHVRSFTDRYNLDKLVWYEGVDDPETALTVEGRMKNWARAWKIREIEKYNPKWSDLYFEHNL